jgi:hypothetical protein
MIRLRRMRWTGHVPLTGLIRNAYKVLVRIPGGKTQFGKCRHRCEDNTSMKRDLRQVSWKGVDWIHLAQDRDQW